MTERVTLKPGDYVSTEGMDQELYEELAAAFMEAGCKGPVQEFEYVTESQMFGWSKVFDQLGHNKTPYPSFSRHLTHDQVLGITNAGGKTQDTLTTILESAAEHDTKAKHHSAEHDRLMWEARKMLPDGWRLVKAEDMPDSPSLTIVDGQDMSDPANWREGDYIMAPKGRMDLQAAHPYKIESFDRDGDPLIKDDSGRICAHGVDDFRFHHRPNT